MTPPSPERARHLLAAALDHDPGEREAFLALACEGDVALLAEVRALLEAHDAVPPGFLDSPAAHPLDATIKSAPGARPLPREFTSPEKAGDVIGQYKLREQIGEGGFGTVWVADQERPVRRRVALKIIKLGMDTEEVIARFEQERQALALMDHPNIARVLDAGATQTGRPYFVMELVRGVKITDYCDDKQLSTQERIELFVVVCQAVQHAHQKGIIHRDLKPSNILVTINDGKAVPKVIDFGVAKATQGRLSENTVYTQFQQMVGTPLYMSPEQAELTSLDIDTRSDIYALGVLLYELLTGRTPIDTATMAKAGMDEIRRLIREVDPPRPSLRMKTLAGDELTTMAKRRHTEPTKLPAALRGDLDWIVMKCLEKDRGRRYDTANGLALDLQRHLKNEVVIARPPTTAYLLGKLMRRNKIAFVAGAAIAASLVVGITISAWQAVRANTALNQLRASAPAFAEQARGLAAMERYGEAIEKLDYAINLRPDAAEFLVAKADLLQSQLKLSQASAIYREALRLQPGHTRAEASAKLCEELLAAASEKDGKLSRASLGKLHVAMQHQQRPAAELLPVARLLGEEKKLLVSLWLDRLQDLPISSEKPLKDRLTVRDDGLLELDLKGTKIASLEPLVDMRTQLGKLVLWDCKEITDFTPLREFRSLTDLDLDGTAISDLSFLRDLPLKVLYIGSSRVSDLSPLRGMKLKTLGMYGTQVSDLSPLAGMPLTEFFVSMIPATDYSALKGAPLEKFMLGDSQVRDLSFLADSPIKALYLSGSDSLRGLDMLTKFKSLERLVLTRRYRNLADEEYAAIGALRTHPTLKWIQADRGEGETAGRQMMDATQPKEVFWKDWDREQAFLPAIRRAGFIFTLGKLPDDTYRLEIEKQGVSDLSMLAGAPISDLRIGGDDVTDLAPLQGLPLRVLRLWANPVADLGPLRGMQLEELSLEATNVSDLSSLKGMPLKKLYLHGCKNLTDVTVLEEIPTLTKLTVPHTARGIEALKNHPNLQWLAFRAGNRNADFPATNSDAFWKRWPTMAWSKMLNETGIEYGASEDAEGHWKVTVTSKEFTDCSVFKGAAIRELILDKTSVADLRPLEELALAKLDIRGTKVIDISPLRAAKLRESLRELYFYRCNISDFSPLAGCTNLELLDASDTSLADLSVVRGLKLRHARLMNTKVADISALAGMPLDFLALSGSAVTDLRPLLQCRKLEMILLPGGARNLEALEAGLPELARISYKYLPSTPGVPAQTAEEFWKEYKGQLWLRDLPAATKVKGLGNNFWEVSLTDTGITDLSIFKKAPISRLTLGNNNDLADLAPLHGLPLQQLRLYNTSVADLKPLEGMALTMLHISKTLVSDLSVVRGMPLTYVRLHSCKALTDLSPLRGAHDLTTLTLPPNAKDIEFLRDRRAFPKLERLSFIEDEVSHLPDKTFDEFWKEYDARKS